MKIYTSFWTSPLLPEVLNARIIGISRTEPNWPLRFEHRSLPLLAPRNMGARWEASYREQLAEIGAARIVERLERIAEGRDAVICLCWEKPGEPCHRRVLAAYVQRETGTSIPELTSGALPSRQPSLFGQLLTEEEQ